MESWVFDTVWDALMFSDIEEEEEEDDMWIIDIYLQYVISVIFLENVIFIQTCIRRHLARKHLHSLRHLHHLRRYGPVVRHIRECGLLPPDDRYPLFAKGGFCYREGYERFIHLNTSDRGKIQS